MPTSKASGASGVREKAPPVWASAEALLLALGEALAGGVALAVAVADVSGQTPSGSNSVCGSVPNNTLTPGLK